MMHDALCLQNGMNLRGSTLENFFSSVGVLEFKNDNTPVVVLYRDAKISRRPHRHVKTRKEEKRNEPQMSFHHLNRRRLLKKVLLLWGNIGQK